MWGLFISVMVTKFLDLPFLIHFIYTYATEIKNSIVNFTKGNL